MQPEQSPILEFKQFLKDCGIDVGLLISGLFGAILLLSKEKNTKSWSQTLFGLIGGAASANYLTPLLIKIMNLEKFDFQYGIAFLLGFLGLKGIEFVGSFLKLPSSERRTRND